MALTISMAAGDADGWERNGRYDHASRGRIKRADPLLRSDLFVRGRARSATRTGVGEVDGNWRTDEPPSARREPHEAEETSLSTGVCLSIAAVEVATSAGRNGDRSQQSRLL
jgi:hypothetical protein